MKSYVRYIMALLCALSVTNGVWGLSNSGIWGATTISSNETVTLSGNVTISGTITINTGVTLTINGNNHTITPYTSTSTEAQGPTSFLVYGTLVINNVTIDGGNTGVIFEEGKTGEQAALSAYELTNFTKAGTTIEVVGKGSVNLTSVTAQNLYANAKGGVAFLHLHNYSTDNANNSTQENRTTATLNKCKITNCLHHNDSGIIYQSNGKTTTHGTITIQEETEISHCMIIKDKTGTGHGGVIKGPGKTDCNLIMKKSQMSYCWSSGWGGAVLWAANFDECKATFEECLFTNNYARYLGGAISSESTIEVSKCTFTNNTAGGGGGAIAAFPFTLEDSDAGSASSAVGLTLTNNTFESNKTLFQNNKEGSNVDNKFFTYTGDPVDPDDNSFNPIYSLTAAKNTTYPTGGGAIWVLMNKDKWNCEVNISSGNTINKNNSANVGGGVFLYKMKPVGLDDYSEVGGKKSGKTTMSIAATIKENIASCLGGGVSISSSESSSPTWEFPNATISGGEISENTAPSGGGIYMPGGNITVTGNATLNKNKATSGNGGGIFLGNGKFTVTEMGQINVGAINNANEAMSGNGGGIYCAGEFEVKGVAKIEHNSAKNGGGVCVESGAVTLSTNTVIKNNKAARGLGGGLYVVNNGGSQKTVAFSGGTFASNEAALGGGACVNGNIILNIASSFENNVANNGGAIYMMNGVTMNFGTGIIKANKAINPTGATFTTAYNAKAVYEVSNGTKIYNGMVNNGTTNVYGFGGGIFMDQSTTFQLTDDAIASKNFGIFNNAAVCGADDIFANGSSTTIKLPAVEKMELSGFKVPNDLYWVEDYPNEDLKYSQGTKKQIKSIAKRYDEALEIDGFELGKLTSNIESIVQAYACITIGYELVFVDLVKTGLLENDDVTFTISYKTPGREYVEFRKVIMTGKGADTPVTKVIALPSGDWKFVESGWGWKYLTPTYYKNEKADANKISEWPIKITKNQNKKIIVENTLNSSLKQIQDFEHRRSNILRPNKVVVTP